MGSLPRLLPLDGEDSRPVRARTGSLASLGRMAAGLVLAGCGQASPSFGPPPPCPAGSRCSAPGIIAGAGGAVSPGDDAGVPGAGVAGDGVADVTGDVIAASRDFRLWGAGVKHVFPTVIGPTPGGGFVADVAPNGSFELAGVEVGDDWFLAAVDGNPPSYYSTYSWRRIEPMPANISLPLVSVYEVAQIAEGLQLTLSDATAQVALVFTRNGEPLEHVVLRSAPPAGATLAFDVNGTVPTAYTTLANLGTGTGGVLLLLGIPASAQRSQIHVEVGVVGAPHVGLDLPIRGGFVTVGDFAF